MTAQERMDMNVGRLLRLVEEKSAVIDDLMAKITELEQQRVKPNEQHSRTATE